MNETQNPDIMLLVIDSLRSDHLGCYGYERDTSPFLDELAKKGVKFENCYANSFWSVPSHASMFTGKLVSDHEIISNDNPELDSKNTLIKSIKDQGYFTYGNSNNMWINDLYGYDKEFDKFDFQLWSSDMGDEESNQILKEIHRRDWNSRKEKYLEAAKKAGKKGPKALFKFAGFKFERKFGKRWGLSDYGATKSIRRIDKTSDEVEKPLFTFCNFMEVHASYSPPLGFKRKFSSYYRPKDGIVNAREKVKGEDLQKRINLYDDCIRYIDSKLEGFIEKYSQKNPETVFLITSDHGELFFDNSLEHEELEQGHDTPSCSDEMLKVPLIIYSKETEIVNLFDEESLISLDQMSEITSSIIKKEKFKGQDQVISENIDKEELSCKIARTEGGKAVIHGETEHLIGDERKAGNLMQLLKDKTKTIQKIESEIWEKEIIEGVDL